MTNETLKATITPIVEEILINTPIPPDPDAENLSLACKIEKISEQIAERFDADGIDDIRIPNKVSIWWVILNLASVAKLVSDIINVIKNECNDNKVSEATLKTNS